MALDISGLTRPPLYRWSPRSGHGDSTDNRLPRTQAAEVPTHIICALLGLAIEQVATPRVRGLPITLAHIVENRIQTDLQPGQLLEQHDGFMEV